VWLLFARAPPPDKPYWPGRRWLAAVDAVVWPCLLLLALLHLPASSGILGALSAALAALSAARRLYAALALNHTYHFTTWRWGRVLAWMLAVGALLKLWLPA
jgi:hypothetical protein